MHFAAWSVDTTDVEEFISELGQVEQHQVRRDLEKLENRGTAAKPPLVGRLDGAVYYLRSPFGARIFYFQDGERSLRAFDAYVKKRKRLPKHVRERVLRRYETIKKEDGR